MDDRHLFALACLGLSVALVAGHRYLAPPKNNPCDFDAQSARDRFTISWARAFAGEELDDSDLQTFSDVDQILKCVSGTKK